MLKCQLAGNITCLIADTKTVFSNGPFHTGNRIKITSMYEKSSHIFLEGPDASEISGILIEAHKSSERKCGQFCRHGIGRGK